MIRVAACLTVLILLSAVSCTQHADSTFVFDEEGTLRHEVNQAAAGIAWTEPVEPDALSADPAGMEEGKLFYPVQGFAAGGSSEAVYPSLEGFGSLDVSAMSASLRSGLNDFMSLFTGGQIGHDSAYFEKPYIGVVALYEAALRPAITEWTFGKPFIRSGRLSVYEVPVLVKAGEQSWVMWLYLDAQKAAAGTVLLQQITFGAMEDE